MHANSSADSPTAVNSHFQVYVQYLLRLRHNYVALYGRLPNSLITNNFKTHGLHSVRVQAAYNSNFTCIIKTITKLT